MKLLSWFRDLQTHMSLSAALTTNMVTKEFTIPWEITDVKTLLSTLI